MRVAARIRLLLTLAGVIALVLAMLTAGFELVLDGGLDHDANSLIAWLLLAALVLPAVGVASHWVISRALRPAARMTEQAAEIDRLDVVCAASSASPPSSRMSFGHRWRIWYRRRSSRFATGTEQTSLRGGFEQVLQSARQMSRTLEALMDVGRAELDSQRSTSDATACARAAIGV